MKDEPFVIERTFNAPVEKVWGALTDKEQMKQWYFDIPAFKAEAGSEFRFVVRDNEGKEWVHLFSVKDAIPNKKLAHSFKFAGYEGDSLVTWELFDEGDRTRVRLTHAGLYSFSAIKGLAKENFAAGWNQIVGASLEKFLAG